MFRYSLRTLLILLAVGPPMLAGIAYYRDWSDRRLWRSFDSAKLKRDELLTRWYDLARTGKASPSDESAVREQFEAARDDVKSTLSALQRRYGNSEEQMQRARELYSSRK